jgi:hypothetical protein
MVHLYTWAMDGNYVLLDPGDNDRSNMEIWISTYCESNPHIIHVCLSDLKKSDWHHPRRYIRIYRQYISPHNQRGAMLMCLRHGSSVVKIPTVW